MFEIFRSKFTADSCFYAWNVKALLGSALFDDRNCFSLIIQVDRLAPVTHFYFVINLKIFSIESFLRFHQLEN